MLGPILRYFCSGLISFLLFPPFLKYWFHWAMVRGGRDEWRKSPLCMSTNAARMLLFLGIPVLMFLGLSQWQLSHVIWYMMWIMKIMFLACGHLRDTKVARDGLCSPKYGSAWWCCTTRWDPGTLWAQWFFKDDCQKKTIHLQAQITLAALIH